MNALSVIAILLTLSAVFGLLNNRTLKLPHTIGELVFAMLGSLALIGVSALYPGIGLHDFAKDFLGSVNLPDTLMNGALSLLLFAGALEVDLGQLLNRKISVVTLALAGTLIAVALLAGGIYGLFATFDRSMPLTWCVVLGAILAPTDPISVVGMLKRLGLPAPLQAVFAGESLFNDGVAIVVFDIALGVATGQSAHHSILSLFLLEAVGGGVLGLALGWLALALLKLARDPHIELLITLALATGTFALANALHMSGPIATVVAGLALGTRTGERAITAAGRHDLERFWSLADEILNAMLFLLIGTVVLAIPLHRSLLVIAGLAIVLAVLARALSVALATLPINMAGGNVAGSNRFGTLAILTWGGLRGGISVALALDLPESPYRNTLLTICYAVVVFTIVVQGLTMEKVAGYFYTLRKEEPPA